MQDIISITEMAKLRQITTETLRHYDRIGILKPVYLDPNTGYRYYSITQYEKLGTIRELKNLGMNLKEIKEYFDNRNIETSRELLAQQKERIDEQISRLINLRKEVNRKIDFLDTIRSTDLDDTIRLKQFEKRKYVAFNRPVTDEIELSYDSVRLEGLLQQSASELPIFATTRYGGIVSKEDIEQGIRPLSAKMVIEYNGEEGVTKEDLIELPPGEYLCMYYVGNFWNREESVDRILAHMRQNNMKLAGDVLQMQWVDFTITDNTDEISYEFQVPVKRINVDLANKR
ncbi:MAG: MerR family transcriptional regulator [Firmicutes bacterium]|nr:MerR family transcriptional regulator [Bacillota bacterium]